MPSRKQHRPREPRFTVHQFNALFPTEEACLDFILDSLYPEGVTCRKCQKVTKHHRLGGRKAYSCQVCGTHVYPLAGTVFAKSSTPLKSWFYGMYLMSSTRCGISAKQLERELGVTYKTAWRMFKQIRLLLSQEPSQFSGTVEADEAYFGGQGKWKHHQGGRDLRSTGKGQKQMVLGMAERGTGRIAASVVDSTDGRTVADHVQTKVLPASTVFTDEAILYWGLPRRGYVHERVNHQQNVYVSGDVHTNTIDGFWSLVKSGIRGSHHSVSAKYLQHYLDEYTFRYNHRDDGKPMFECVTEQLASTRFGRYGAYQPIG